MADGKHWDGYAGCYRVSPRADAFLADIVAACQKHGLSLAHQDGHGAFLIVPYSDEVQEWLADAALQGVEE